jgi:hypothetical protein
MILFINTFITDKCIPNSSTSANKKSNRALLKECNQIDIFKYSLASLAPIHKWNRIILNISLDSNYLDKKDDLESFIRDEYKGCEIFLSWKRNVFKSEWQQTYELFNEELIWFNCNHDHIVLDSSPNYLNFILGKMKKDELGPISSYYTHWPENIAHLSHSYKFDSLRIFEEYATLRKETCDSINIISKNLYHKWWFSDSVPAHLAFPRPDWSRNMLSSFVSVPDHKQFIQYKELSRHFDAYYHLTVGQCPALNIPDGFFDNNINILIGGASKTEGQTWFNPLIEKFSSEDLNGVDYKMLEADIPLFWKNRIAKIDRYSFDENSFIEYRLKSVIGMVNLNEYTPHKFDESILKLVLNVWLKPYNKKII